MISLISNANASANAYRVVDSAAQPLIAAAVADQQDGGQVEPQSGGDSVNISDEAIQALEQDRSQANLEAQVDQILTLPPRWRNPWRTEPIPLSCRNRCVRAVAIPTTPGRCR